MRAGGTRLGTAEWQVECRVGPYGAEPLCLAKAWRQEIECIGFSLAVLCGRQLRKLRSWGLSCGARDRNVISCLQFLMMYRSSALLGLTVWLVSGLVFSTATDDASCASNAPPSGQSPSLLAVKAETHSVAGLAVLEDAKTVNSTNASNASANVTLEGLVKNNVVDNMNEINAMPKLENRSDEINASNITGNGTNSTTTNTTNGTSVNGTNRPRHGFGELAVNLEFITLKLAQLETVAELQQVEIHKLLQKVDEQDPTRASSGIFRL